MQEGGEGVDECPGKEKLCPSNGASKLRENEEDEDGEMSKGP